MKNFQFIFILFTCAVLYSQKKHDEILLSIDNNNNKYEAAASAIWNLAEMGYQEYKSAAILQELLKQEGFSIQKGVAGIPTAFIANYGSGSPEIAILGEYDALPGLSQKAIPYKESNNGKAGHACGHHLFGTASAAAAIALKEYLVKTKKSGTVKFFGCPAEEWFWKSLYD